MIEKLFLIWLEYKFKKKDSRFDEIKLLDLRRKKTIKMNYCESIYENKGAFLSLKMR